MKLNWQLIILTWILCVIPSMALGQVKVVATLPTLGALAREVGGSDITVEVLARPGEDPHFVDPRPDFVLKLSRADLLIHNGMELEIGWLPALQKNARNARVQANGEGVLDTSTFIQPLEVPTGKVDRSDGDVHAKATRTTYTPSITPLPSPTESPKNSPPSIPVMPKTTVSG